MTKSKMDEKILTILSQFEKDKEGREIIEMGTQLMYEHVKEEYGIKTFTKRDLQIMVAMLSFSVKAVEMNAIVDEMSKEDRSFTINKQFALVWGSLLKEMIKREEKINEII